MFAVAMRVDIGRKPATVVSPCETCARAFITWVRTQNFAARMEQFRFPADVLGVDESGAGYAEAVLAAFRRWSAHYSGIEGCDHLKVLRPE
jgi:hypothetical protein